MKAWRKPVLSSQAHVRSATCLVSRYPSSGGPKKVADFCPDKVPVAPNKTRLSATLNNFFGSKIE